MSKSCKGSLDDYLDCIERSACVATEKRDPRDCAKGANGAERPSECETKRGNYLQCRRGQLDMRTRLRGNKGY
ncbi:Cytochrome c oxidase assembly protein PET191 [Ostreococcus tauri]|uniref:Cytochrome c oxidase assembly protein PET191 n=1 Tax=Ostreococcus tauri TaxID=70448 RepID=A0A090M5C0_OSTTA|nr:Cytochrome c oxidase assembly protein PET191 [Ostreococcus tauri]OUS44097.1 cytochrome c oxidase assembly protein PET191 [Ostreococcus tauri]CEF97329.1 Cytochrome c oxidase assembly protein PET191 [Ostreococcus tauri]|eukprot:XP_003078425.2 Cytochrome c oxidase assembly protein PET191 [Ostreococcus tauri]